MINYAIVRQRAEDRIGKVADIVAHLRQTPAMLEYAQELRNWLSTLNAAIAALDQEGKAMLPDCVLDLNDLKLYELDNIIGADTGVPHIGLTRIIELLEEQ